MRTSPSISTEVSVGRANGLDQESAVSCDNILTVPVSAVGRLVGYLLPDQERALSEAIFQAFELDC